MTPEAKKQLEEMAKKYSEMKEKDFYLAGNAPLTLIRSNPTKFNAYRAGAQAAWDLAVEHEREGAKKILTIFCEDCESPEELEFVERCLAKIQERGLWVGPPINPPQEAKS